MASLKFGVRSGLYLEGVTVQGKFGLCVGFYSKECSGPRASWEFGLCLGLYLEEGLV